MAYSYLLKASSMPDSQEFDGIQLLLRHQVCPIHRNLMAYKYLVKVKSMPHSQELDGIQLSFEGIKYVPFTRI